MDLLTPSINVPAERAKLRRLRNEINADAQARLTHQRHYTARGYRRKQLPELPSQQQQPAFRTGADDLPAVLRAPGGEDATEQGAGQSHVGRDCPTPQQPAARAGAAAGGRDADRMTTQPEKTA